jgi:glycosyltransferase involved in cell wall biosynthesis
MRQESNQPIVSLLVPVYNVASYLRAAIESLLAQTFMDFELILINDGSTDGSDEIINEYSGKDSRIRVIHKENEGVARTLNLGLDLARGKYIRRFDSDDTCLPKALEKQVAFMEEHPEFALVSTQQAYQTERGKIAWNHRMPRNAYLNGEPYRVVKGEDFYDYCPIVHATALFRRDVAIVLRGYRTEFLTSEDNDLWLRMVEKYPMAVLNDCSYFVRLHATSATKQHASSCAFYRELALKFHEERLEKGSDPLMREEAMPQPPKMQCDNGGSLVADGQTVRVDLNFIYSLMIDAKDWKNSYILMKEALKFGWKNSGTYKLLLFPLLGPSLVQAGVKIKSLFR